MTKSIIIYKNGINYGILFILYSILIVLMKSSFISGNNFLSLTITLDLLFSIPIIYLLLIYKNKIPKITILSIISIGYFIGSYFLPEENQNYLNLFKVWIFPILKVYTLTFSIIKIRLAFILYKKLKNTSTDFFDIIKKCCAEFLPKELTILFATEIAIIYYGFIHWKTIKHKENEFSYHKNSGTQALLGALILLIVIETTYLHVLLEQWDIWAAWILTMFSSYTAIQIFGFAKSISKRPISVNKHSLSLRYGLLSEVEIPFSKIHSIVLSKSYIIKDEKVKTLSPLGKFEDYNLIIHLNRECELTGFYGVKKKFKTLGFYLDDPHTFIEKTENLLQQELQLVK